MLWTLSLSKSNARRVIDKMITRFALILCTLLVSACSTSVNLREQNNSPLSGIKISQVRVALSAEADKMRAENLYYSHEKLVRALEDNLNSSSVFSRNGASAARLNLEVTSIRTRSTFSAVMFGLLAGDDHIKGTARLLDESGVQILAFDVSSVYAFGGIAGGAEDVRMSWLYDDFSKSVTKILVGKLQ